jgi:hypothetical protein
VLRGRLVVLVWLASCGAWLAGCVRAPAPLDVAALVAARGPVEARRDLQIRVTGDPRDVAAWLGLAALAEAAGRPTEAIAALEAVVALGGPLGVRWRDEDRARLARLIAARGRARLARGAATALADLERARGLGAAVTGGELGAAQAAGAIAALHHSDAELRDGGRRTLAALSSEPAGARSDAALSGEPAWVGARADAALNGEPAWVGARSDALPEQRARFGAWLWERGARRAAWDELSAWHAATRPPRDPALQAAYLVAARWWIPLDRPAPPAEDLVGAARCAFMACPPEDILGDDDAERAYLAGPPGPRLREPSEAAAVAAIALRQALRGEASWGAALAARVEVAAFADPKQLAKLPRSVQPIFARLVGREPVMPPLPAGGPGSPAPGDPAAPDQRLVIAAGRILAGATELAPLDGVPYGDELRRVAAPRAPFDGDAAAARADAIARHASVTVGDPGLFAPLRAIVVAYRGEPSIADRLGRDAVAGAVDAAAMHAALGALFDALGDPARARASWQAAVDASPEPVFLRGLAQAQALQGDPDAALVSATSAAAASGDPAVVWITVARGLAAVGKYVHALDAARSAIDLAGPETLAAALEIAGATSRALGRDAQAAALDDQRARLAPPHSHGERDPTDAAAALDAHRRGASGATIARLWVASRWNPRSVELRAALLAAIAPGDPRRAVVTGELVDLAGDRDPERRLAAVLALGP